MNTKNLFLALVAAVLMTAVAGASTMQMPMVTIGDAGNLADPLTGYGAVPYVYQIGAYDVTTAQYTGFLNAVAEGGDPYGLYTPGMATDLPTDGITQTSSSGRFTYAVRGNGNVPVTDVTWGDAARFVNWLQNGQPTGAEGPGTTETGTYTLNGGTSSAALMAVSRSTTSTWVLPTADEWYKAAYYQSGGTNNNYWQYATRSNNPPSNVLSATGTNNANFSVDNPNPPFNGLTDPVNYVTPVGAFAASRGPYGTFDQNGDVWQWIETADGSEVRDLRGGGFGDGVGALYSVSQFGGNSPTDVSPDCGFRVASVPEPGSMSLLLAAAMVLSVIRLCLSVMERSMWRGIIMSFAMKAVWARSSFRKALRAPRYARQDWFARQKWYSRQRWHPKRHRHVMRPRLRFESLSVECLEPRCLLAGLYWDGASAAWTTTNWYNSASGGTKYPWTDGSTAYIQSASCSITIAGQVSPAGVHFGFGTTNASYVVSGGAIAPSADTVIDVYLNTTGEIDSNITGSNFELQKQGYGTLVLGGSGSVTVAALNDSLGTLEIDNSVSITDGNASGEGLLVANDAILQGTGTVTLAATAPLLYQSSAPSDFSGSIAGAGTLQVDTSSGELTLDGSDNSNNTYGGGTFITLGTLALSNGARPGDPTGILQVDSIFNMKGCGVTVGSLRGTGTVENTSSVSATLEVDTNEALDIFAGDISDVANAQIVGAISLKKGGSGTLALAGVDSYFGSTEIVSGTLQLDSDRALPIPGYQSTMLPPTDLTIDSTGRLDLNSFSPTVATVNGASGAIITDNSNSTSTNLTLFRDDSSNSSVFAGTIEDGANSVISLSIYSGPQTLTGQNRYGGGTILNDGRLYLGDGTSNGNGMITGPIESQDEDDVYFDVAAGTTETFSGYFVSSNGDCSMTKTGAGTLVLSPSQQDQYFRGTLIDEGKLVLGNAYALPGGTGLPGGAGDVTIVNGTTLDLGGLSGIPAVNDVYLTDGMITDGTLSLLTNAFIQAQYGEIDASLSGAAGLEKIQYAGPQSFPDVPPDTVIVGTSSDSGSLTGTIKVTEGTLAVNGTLGGTGSTVKVGSDATSPVGTLGGTGTLPGSVTIYDTGILSLGAAAGGNTITLGKLDTEIGSSIDDYVGSQDTCLAQINGALTINGGTVATTGGGTNTVPYQVLFHYGSLNLSGGAGFGNLAPTNTALVDNSPGSSIDVAVSGTPRYWETNSTLGGNGNWDGTTANWFASPTGTSAVPWQSGDIAIFENVGTVTLAGYTAYPAEVLFLSDYTIGGTGTLSLPANASITIAAGSAAAINAVVAGTNGLLADLPGATLALNNQHNTYSDGTTILEGTLQVPSNSCLGSSSATIAFDAGTLQATGILNLSAPIVLDQGGGTFDTNGFVASTLSGQITGTGGLTVIDSSGGGALVLTATNNGYTGGTVVDSGTLSLGAAGAFPAGTSLTVNTNGIFDLGGCAITVGLLNGSGEITNNSSSPSTLTIDQAAGTEYSGTIQDGSATGATVGIVVTGGGALTLDPTVAGGNTFSGGIVIGNATLNISADNALGVATGSVAFDGNGLLQWGGSFDLSDQRVMQIAANCTATIDTDSYVAGVGGVNAGIPGVISGSGSLTVTGSGTLTLSGANTFGGLVTLVSGTLSLGPVSAPSGTTAALPTGTNLTINGGTLILNGLTTAVLDTVTLNNGTIGDYYGGTLQASGTFTVYNGQISADLAGPAGLTMEGTYLDSVTLSGVNTYSAGTTLVSGTLLLGNALSLPFGADLAVNGGLLNLAAQSVTIGSLSGTGGTIINDYGSPCTLTVDQATNSAYHGSIQDGYGTVALIVSGTGTLKLDPTAPGGNTYSNGTIVASGILIITRADSLADDTALTVAAGGTLIYDPSLAAAPLDAGDPNAGGTPTPPDPGGPAVDPPNDAAPAVAAILCVGQTLVDADSVAFTVDFTRAVTGVTPADFAIAAGGTIGTVAAVSGSGSQFTVTVSGISGSGALGLMVLADGRIEDRLGTALADHATAPLSEQYTIDRQLYWAPSSDDASGTSVWDAGYDYDWRVGGPTGPLQQYCDGSDVVFGGSPGTVEIVNPVVVSSMTFLCDGYVLEGGTITLAPPALPGAGGIIDVAAGSATIDCQIAGAALDKTGNGALVLGATDSYASCTTLDDGLLRLQSRSALPAQTALVVNGGVFDLGGLTAAGLTTVTLAGGSIIDGGLQVGTAMEFYSGSVLADLSGAAGLDKLGPGTVILAGQDTYQGGTIAWEGTLVAQDGGLPGAVTGPGTVILQPTLYWTGDGDWTTGQWQLADGTPTPWIDGSSVVLAAGSEIQVSGSVNVSSIIVAGDATIDGGTLQLSSASITVLCETATIDSTIAGSAGLVKAGTGILVLDGTLAYSGATTVVGGTLDIMSPLAAAPLTAGGQAIGPGSIFSADGTSLFDLDPAMFNLVQSLFVDQAIDRAGMIQILESAVGNGAVTSSALSALETLTTPQNESQLNMPNYVAVLASDVVQGNPANANYQGQPLGNLADQGSDQLRATALGDLVDKWFYGTDLPAVVVGTTYTAVAGSLFGDNADQSRNVPNSSDMHQGALGDCYLISALGALAGSSPAAIESMFIDNGVENGVQSWTVRFYYNDPLRGYVADYVTVNSMLPIDLAGNLGYAGAGTDGSLWMPLLEKAYAQWNETGREGRDGQNSYASLNGGLMQDVDAQVLGSTPTTFYPAGNTSAKQALIDALQSNAAVTAAIFGDDAEFSQLGLVSCHAYDVVGYDDDPASPTFDTFQLKNPWGFDDPAPLTWSELCAYCPWLAVADTVGTDVGPGSQQLGSSVTFGDNTGSLTIGTGAIPIFASSSIATCNATSNVSAAASAATPGGRSATTAAPATTIARDLAWLGRAASASDSSDPRHKKNVAIQALDAMFAQYGR